MTKTPCLDCGRPCMGDSAHPRCLPCWQATLPGTSPRWLPCSECRKSCRSKSGVCRACCADGRGPIKRRKRSGERKAKKMPARANCSTCGVVTRTVSGVCVPCQNVDESARVLTGGDWVPRPGGVWVWVAASDDRPESEAA